jgi:hypothetical protein
MRLLVIFEFVFGMVLNNHTKDSKKILHIPVPIAHHWNLRFLMYIEVVGCHL